MTSLTATQLFRVWLFLSALTLASWLLSSAQDALRIDVAVTLGVLASGYIKCRLILQHFMEVRTSGRDLRLFSDIWLASLFAAMALLYLYGSLTTG